MQRISRSAAEGDEESNQILETMLAECSGKDWRTRNHWCSAVVHALANTRADRALTALIRHIQALPGSMAFGPVELIASLLPVFENRALAPAFEMADSENPTIRAIGLQVLCNFYLEDLLPDNETERLEALLRDFRRDDYMTQHVADLVRFKASRVKPTEDENEIEEMFADILVENTGG
jgi:hypothetical protein